MLKRLLKDDTHDDQVADEKPAGTDENKDDHITHENKQPKSNTYRLRLQLLSHGYFRKYFTSRNINPIDIASIIVTYLFEDWKFDYYYDAFNEGPTMHRIENDGKQIKCKNVLGCPCFYSMFSFGMKR